MSKSIEKKNSLEYAAELFSQLTESEKLYILERITMMLEEKQDK